MRDEEICGTCRWHKKDRETGEWCCDNEETDLTYGLPTEYRDACDEWEGRG